MPEPADIEVQTERAQLLGGGRGLRIRCRIAGERYWTRATVVLTPAQTYDELETTARELSRSLLREAGKL